MRCANTEKSIIIVIYLHVTLQTEARLYLIRKCSLGEASQ